MQLSWKAYYIDLEEIDRSFYRGKYKFFELLHSPFTPPQPSPCQGEGAKPPLSKGGLGGVNQPTQQLKQTLSPQIVGVRVASACAEAYRR